MTLPEIYTEVERFAQATTWHQKFQDSNVLFSPNLQTFCL